MLTIVASMPMASPTMSSTGMNPVWREAENRGIGFMISATGDADRGREVVRRLVRPRLQPGHGHRELAGVRLRDGSRTAGPQRRDGRIRLDIWGGIVRIAPHLAVPRLRDITRLGTVF